MYSYYVPKTSETSETSKHKSKSNNKKLGQDFSDEVSKYFTLLSLDERIKELCMEKKNMSVLKLKLVDCVEDDEKKYLQDDIDDSEKIVKKEKIGLGFQCMFFLQFDCDNI